MTAMCPRRFSKAGDAHPKRNPDITNPTSLPKLDEPYTIKLTIPARLKSKYPITFVITSIDYAEVVFAAGHLMADLEARYGMKPEVLILP